MFNFKPQSRITLCPNVPEPKCGSNQFRWHMHVALPFPIPSKSSLTSEFVQDGMHFRISLSSGIDRVTRIPSKSQAPPQTILLPGEKKLPEESQNNDDYVIKRESLQGVAYCEETTEYTTLGEARDNLEKKISAAFKACQLHIQSIQKSIPYELNWSVYAPSFYECGSVYFGVDHFCKSTNEWTGLLHGQSCSIPRRLHHPVFVINEPIPELDSTLDLCNEMLCEASGALMRELNRTALIQACTAVEILANKIYVDLRIKYLVDKGLPTEDAEKIAESERKSHRTDENFLLATGLKDIGAPSLLDEDKTLYDNFKKYKDQRHQIAHAGVSATNNEAGECFSTCCKVVLWLCGIADIQCPSLNTDISSHVPGFFMKSGESFVLSPIETQVLSRLMVICGASTTEDK